MARLYTYPSRTAGSIIHCRPPQIAEASVAIQCHRPQITEASVAAAPAPIPDLSAVFLPLSAKPLQPDNPHYLSGNTTKTGRG